MKYTYNTNGCRTPEKLVSSIPNGEIFYADRMGSGEAGLYMKTDRGVWGLEKTGSTRNPGTGDSFWPTVTVVEGYKQVSSIEVNF